MTPFITNPWNPVHGSTRQRGTCFAKRFKNITDILGDKPKPPWTKSLVTLVRLKLPTEDE